MINHFNLIIYPILYLLTVFDTNLLFLGILPLNLFLKSSSLLFSLGSYDRFYNLHDNLINVLLMALPFLSGNHLLSSHLDPFLPVFHPYRIQPIPYQ